MLPEIAEAQEQIKALCEKYCVRRLEIFGSAVTGKFRPEESDLDFLVEFEEPVEPGDLYESYFGLLEGLEDAFGRHVDLVDASTIENPYFRESVEETKVLLYAA